MIYVFLNVSDAVQSRAMSRVSLRINHRVWEEACLVTHRDFQHLYNQQNILKTQINEHLRQNWLAAKTRWLKTRRFTKP
jgi:hypothetical protein